MGQVPFICKLFVLAEDLMSLQLQFSPREIYMNTIFQLFKTLYVQFEKILNSLPTFSIRTNVICNVFSRFPATNLCTQRIQPKHLIIYTGLGVEIDFHRGEIIIKRAL